MEREEEEEKTSGREWRVFGVETRRFFRSWLFWHARARGDNEITYVFMAELLK
jgi:hypothetical protein